MSSPSFPSFLATAPSSFRDVVLCAAIATGILACANTDKTSADISNDPGDACPSYTPAGLNVCCDSVWGRSRYTNVPVEDYACAEECNHHFEKYEDLGYEFNNDGPLLCESMLISESGELVRRVDPARYPVRTQDISYVPLDGACDESGYGKIDRCYNSELPPRPSVERLVSSALPGRDDGVAYYNHSRYAETGDADWEEFRPSPGDTQVLPFTSQTADGLVQLITNHSNWPSLAIFRPDLMHEDEQLPAQAPDEYPGTKSDRFSPISHPGRGASIHMLAYFDPSNTDYDIEGPDAHVTSLKSRKTISTLHSAICENSSVAAGGGPRNPTPCRARYGRFNYELDPSLPAVREDYTMREGLCYNITYLAGANAHRANDPDGPSKWELRSAPLTVFVPNAMTCEAGNDDNQLGEREWIYPINPEGAFDNTSGGVVNLPDFAEYDLTALFPWKHSQGDQGALVIADYGTKPTVPVTDYEGNQYDVPAQCYTASGAQNPDAPKWCAFLFNQSRRSEFFFDNDLDELPERHPTGSGLTLWDGRTDAGGSVGGNALFELITTADGRLLIMNANNGLYYSTNDGDPCSAAGFESFLPISSMPVDPRMAEYPVAHAHGGRFRDPSGQEMTPGSIGHFAYPWIDREGKNLFFAAVNRVRNVYKVRDIDITREWHDGNRQDEIIPSRDDLLERNRRFMAAGAGHHIAVIGAWTRGKMVILDNGLNASDVGGSRGLSLESGQPYAHKYRFRLYDDATLNFRPGPVTLINSFENRLNHFNALRPTAPFDVVWKLSSNNQHNSEVIFDEYMADNAFVVAHMNASATQYEDALSNKRVSLLEVNDGFVTGNLFGLEPNYYFNTDPGQSRGGRVKLQNAAGVSPVTDLRVRGGARIEPVVLGGVLGRGLFLDGKNDFVEFDYPAEAPGDSWYLGLWIDLRDFPGHGISELYRFPDGSWIGIEERLGTPYYEYDLVAVDKNGGVRRTYLRSLSKPGSYFHLGLRISGPNSSRSIEVLVNGTRLVDMDVGRGFDLMASDCGSRCTMTISSRNQQTLAGENVHPLRAWIDELRIYRLRDDIDGPVTWMDEFLCNLALGSQVWPEDLPAGEAKSALLAVADRYEDISGQRPFYVCEQLSLANHDRPTTFAPQGDALACANQAHKNKEPNICLREALLEMVPLSATAPRPDTQDSAFCTSCHSNQAETPGLGMSAIAGGVGPRFLDHRRQPLDRPAFVPMPVQNLCGQSDAPWFCAVIADGASQMDGFSVPMDLHFDSNPLVEPQSCQ